MTERLRPRFAVTALALVIAVTVSWWVLALWPTPADTPEWVLRTREVCFGSTAESLPTAAGWLVLVGQPIGMLLLLGVAWGRDLREGLRLVLSRVTGQLATGAIAAALVVGAGAAVVRVQSVGQEPFDPGGAADAAALTRINDLPPALELTDQFGRQVTLERLRGRPVIVTFAYAHCATVCPTLVRDVLAAQRSLERVTPEVLVITLDPWRDTPRRLPAIAEAWRLPNGARVLSGEPEIVERTLNAWRIPRTRNERTGDIIHPSLVYVIGADGRIRYVVGPGTATLTAAIRSL